MTEQAEEPQRGCAAFCNDYARNLKVGPGRKKALTADVKGLLKTNLQRCLKAPDLVAYGLASMLGGSIYVLTGAVMQKNTGPAVFVAYFIAGMVAMLNSLVYSELACRIPKAGSSYSYAYIMLGELVAFMTGWSILLEYILGAATVTRGWSNMLDGLTGGKVGDWIIRNVGRLGNPGDVLAEYPDLIGCALIIIFTGIACCGVRRGAHVTAFFIIIYVGVILAISIFMYVYANTANIAPPLPSTVKGPDPLSPNPNFLPFGLGGLVGGVAICFNAFIGFDAISACAEEAESPSRDLPRANAIAVLTVTFLTVFASLALVLYHPWYLTSAETPFLSGLRDNLSGGSVQARTGMFYFVGIGCLVGLSSSLLSTLVAGPRVGFAMAEDGLLPPCFAKVCHPFKTPVIATISMASITIILDMLFSIVSLADFLSLGTLMAYSMASIGLLVLRYKSPPELRDGLKNRDEPPNYESIGGATGSTDQLIDLNDPYAARTGKPGYLRQSWAACLPRSLVRRVNRGHPGQAVGILIPIYILFTVGTILFVKIGEPEGIWPIWRLVMVPIMLILMILCVFFMVGFVEHPSPRRELFRLPLVPFFPCATLAINMFLIAELSVFTWIRFAVWLGLGLLIYFFYGIYSSSEAVGLYSRSTVKRREEEYNDLDDDGITTKGR